MRVSDSRIVITGSTKEKCNKCNEEVYISKAMKNRIKNLTVEIICTHCVPEGVHRVEAMSSEQLKELNESTCS